MASAEAGESRRRSSKTLLSMLAVCCALLLLLPGYAKLATLIVPVLWGAAYADRRALRYGARLPANGRYLVVAEHGRIHWADVLGIRVEADAVVLETRQGDRRIDPTVSDLGRLVAEVRRRCRPEAVSGAPTLDRQALRRWLSLAADQRHEVRTATDAKQHHLVHSPRYPAVWLPLVGLAVCRNHAATVAVLVCYLVVFFRSWAAGRRHRQSPLAWFDDECMEFDDRCGQRTKLPWHQLVALRDEDDSFTLVTTVQDLTILADGEAAAAVRHTAQQVLAALAANGGWLATPGAASLSPAERLTGEADRGLSQVDVTQE